LQDDALIHATVSLGNALNAMIYASNQALKDSGMRIGLQGGVYKVCTTESLTTSTSTGKNAGTGRTPQPVDGLDLVGLRKIVDPQYLHHSGTIIVRQIYKDEIHHYGVMPDGMCKRATGTPGNWQLTGDATSLNILVHQDRDGGSENAYKACKMALAGGTWVKLVDLRNKA
jgi:hypothetical protein